MGTGLGLLAGTWIPSSLQHFGSGVLASWTGWLLAALLVLGAPYALLGWTWGASRRLAGPSRVAVVALAAVVIDSARSHGVLGLPWLLLGHSQAGGGVAQLAVVGGVPLLSGVLVAANAALAQTATASWERRRLRWDPSLLPILGAALGLAMLGLPVAEAFDRTTQDSASEGAQVLLVQPNLPVEERWAERVQRTNLRVVAALTEEALQRGSTPPDIIVWPETILTTPIDADVDLARALRNHARSLPADLVLGAVRSADRPQRYRNSAIWLESGRVAGAVDKVVGVPLVESGEFFSGSNALRRLIGQPDDALRLEAGRETGPLALGGRPSFAVAFCFEIIFPHLVAGRRGADSSAILNLANDSWFEGPAVSRHQIAFGSFRAIEQRLPLLRVAHGGISAVVDRFGRVRETIAFDTTGSASVVVTPGSGPTAGGRGALVALGLAGAAAGFLTDRILRRWTP